MNVKEWFENGTGLEIKELRYLKNPGLPYNIYIDDEAHRGADKLNNIIEHNIVLEHYSESEEKSEEKNIENFLNNQNVKFYKKREWLEEEEIFVTTYELEPYLEKRKDV